MCLFLIHFNRIIFLIFTFCFLALALKENNCKCRLLSEESNENHTNLLEAPWLASISSVASVSHFAELSHICSAVIVNEFWLLTSAICLKHRSLSNILVGVGSNDLKALNSNERYKIEKVYLHPAIFIDVSVGDIALIKLQKPLIFNETVQPACLDYQPEKFKKYQDHLEAIESTPLLMIGWGPEKPPSLWSSLQLQRYCRKIEFIETIEPIEICDRFPHKICVISSNKEKEKVLASPSDAGSPLMLTKQGKTKIVGLFSREKDDVPEGKIVYQTPQKFTRLSIYMNWIKKHIKFNFCSL